MSATKCTRTPGHPRNFDPEVAVAKVQSLFHAHGCDAVSVADVIVMLLIKPPSFYAAFGNRIGLCKRVLDRYVQAEVIPSDDTFRLDKPISACLIDLFEEATRHYVANPHTPGCLILEDTHSNGPQVRKVARSFHSVTEHKTYDLVAQRHPKGVGSLTDYVSTTIPDLSGKARCGCSFERLLVSAWIASIAV